jgi:hypothetical protein
MINITGSFKAFSALSPYLFLRHGPQNWPRTPIQLPERHIVFVSNVFCLQVDIIQVADSMLTSTFIKEVEDEVIVNL